MKYPQLVPTRAVNALSDWLVYNLEELGVEAPLVYSRLLLSLLHTAIQIDTVELSDIPHFKEFLNQNKNQQLDTEELKRFAAVQILIEATSSDNSVPIVDLVNELHQKIHEIEKAGHETKCSCSASKLTDTETSPKTISLERIREKYYSAFPALDKESTPSEKFANSNIVTTAAPPATTRTTTKHFGMDSSGQHRSNVASATAASWSSILNKPSKKPKATSTKKKASTKAIDIPSATAAASGADMKRRSHRNKSKSFNAKRTSVSPWDMNFNGTWEMTSDPIRKFARRHQQQRRNRSNSEGDKSVTAECNNNSTVAADKENQRWVDGEDEKLSASVEATVCDLSSYLPAQIINETAVDGASDMVKPPPPPLQRESTTLSSLKAKFDSIRAIWDDCQEDEEVYNSPAPAAAIWEPLNKVGQEGWGHVLFEMECRLPVETAMLPREVAKIWEDEKPRQQQQHSMTNDFIQNGTNLVSSIWSANEQEGELSSATRTPIVVTGTTTTATADVEEEQNDLNCREIFDNFEKLASNEVTFMSLPKEIAAEMPEIETVPLPLINHSDAFSAFRDYKRTEFYRPPPPAPQLFAASPLTADDASVSSDENLLEAKRTHFAPIRDDVSSSSGSDYTDGHTFEISSAYNPVAWQRSPSGNTLYLNSDAYQELHLDGDAEDEEFALLEAERAGLPAPPRFTVKFRVKTTGEKACQTDAVPEELTQESFVCSWTRAQKGWRCRETLLHDTHLDLIDYETMDEMAYVSDETAFSFIYESGDLRHAYDLKSSHCTFDSQRIWASTGVTFEATRRISSPADEALRDELQLDGEALMSTLDNLHLYSSFDGEDPVALQPSEEEIDPMVHQHNEIIKEGRLFKKVDTIVNYLTQPETAKTMVALLDCRIMAAASVAKSRTPPDKRFAAFCPYFDAEQRLIWTANCNSVGGGGGGGGGGLKMERIGDGRTFCVAQEKCLPIRLQPNTHLGISGISSRKRRHSACRNLEFTEQMNKMNRPDRGGQGQGGGGLGDVWAKQNIRYIFEQTAATEKEQYKDLTAAALLFRSGDLLSYGAQNRPLTR